MLKEGWDVTNLYTIVPLRAANARILIEQSIGRGLRLPYGKRTGVTAVDRLNIVAHDKFQEIIDEANKPDSAIRLQQVILDAGAAWARRRSRWCRSRNWRRKLGIQPAQTTSEHAGGRTAIEPPVFNTPEEQKVAQIAYEVIRKLENQPQMLPSVTYLTETGDPGGDRQGSRGAVSPVATGIGGRDRAKPDIAAIVAKTDGVGRCSRPLTFRAFWWCRRARCSRASSRSRSKLDTLNYPPVSEELWIQHLRTNQRGV